MKNKDEIIKELITKAQAEEKSFETESKKLRELESKQKKNKEAQQQTAQALQNLGDDFLKNFPLSQENLKKSDITSQELFDYIKGDESLTKQMLKGNNLQTIINTNGEMEVLLTVEELLKQTSPEQAFGTFYKQREDLEKTLQNREVEGVAADQTKRRVNTLSKCLEHLAKDNSLVTKLDQQLQEKKNELIFNLSLSEKDKEEVAKNVLELQKHKEGAGEFITKDVLDQIHQKSLNPQEKTTQLNKIPPSESTTLSADQKKNIALDIHERVAKIEASSLTKDEKNQSIKNLQESYIEVYKKRYPKLDKTQLNNLEKGIKTSFVEAKSEKTLLDKVKHIGNALKGLINKDPNKAQFVNANKQINEQKGRV